MIERAREALEAVLTHAEVDVTDIAPQRIEPRREGEIYGFEVATDTAEDSVLMFVDTSKPSKNHLADRVTAITNPEGGGTSRVWTYPFDPDLPALPAAAVGDATEVLLRRLGLSVAHVELEMMSYRPGRRAVVKITTDTGSTYYLKVIRPSQIDVLTGIHRDFLAAGLPVPEVKGWSPEGLILLDELPGAPVSQHIEEISRSTEFTGQLHELVAQIREVPTKIRAKAGSIERLTWYRDMVQSSLPDAADLVAQLYDAVTDRLPERTERLTRHGDLHIDQIMVDPTDPARVTGLLDIDTSGVARYDTDPSFMYADLVVRAARSMSDGDEPSARHAQNFASSLREAFDIEPAMVAAQLLAHALGPAVQGGDQQHQLAHTILAAAQEELDQNP